MEAAPLPACASATACLARELPAPSAHDDWHPDFPPHPWPSPCMANLEVKSRSNELPPVAAGVYAQLLRGSSTAGRPTKLELPSKVALGLRAYVVLPLVGGKSETLGTCAQRWRFTTSVSGEVLGDLRVSACCMAAMDSHRQAGGDHRLRWRRHRCARVHHAWWKWPVDVPRPSVNGD